MFVSTCYFGILGDAPPYILHSCFLTLVVPMMQESGRAVWCTNNIHTRLQCSASVLRDRAGLLYIWQYEVEMSPTSRPCSRFSDGLGENEFGGN